MTEDDTIGNEGEQTATVPRFLGRGIACEGILRARFGERPASAGAAALGRLRQAAPEPRAAVRIPAAARVRTRMPAARPRPWGWWITGLAACVLIGLAALWKGRIPAIAGSRTAAVAVLRDVRGEVSLVRAGSVAPAQADANLFDNDRVLTAPETGAARAVFTDGSWIRLAAGGELVLQKPPGTGSGRAVLVADGAVEVEAAGPFLLRSRHAEVRVLGTHFDARVTPAETRVNMTKGRAEVVCLRTHQATILETGAAALVGESLAVSQPRTGHGLLALYTFQEPAGRIVRDVSGATPPLDLVIRSALPPRRLPGGGLSIESDTKIVSDGPAVRLIEACRATGQLTVETWVRSSSPTQGGDGAVGPSRIVTLSLSWDRRNLTLGQFAGDYIVRLRTTRTDDNGLLGKSPHEGVVHASLGPDIVALHQVAVTFSARSGEVRLFVDGEQKASRQIGGDLSNWETIYPLALAAEGHDDWKWWHGELYLVAVYNAALEPAEIAQNYAAEKSLAARPHAKPLPSALSPMSP